MEVDKAEVLKHLDSLLAATEELPCNGKQRDILRHNYRTVRTYIERSSVEEKDND